MANLRDRFEELIHMEWGAFCELEQDQGSSVDDSVLCNLIRICSDTDDISASKLAFDRIDGTLETPIDVKIPKFYIRYVNAKEVDTSQKSIEAPKNDSSEETKTYDPATSKLRETLREMRRMPKDVIRAVLLYKKRIEKGIQVETEPTVKAVMVANLLKNVQKGRFKAIELVFDQIDGKLTKTIELLNGKDVYVDDFNTLIAPAHATLDENGTYIAEDDTMTANWVRGFAQSQKGLEMILEADDD